jgi:hypothetical protein
MYGRNISERDPASYQGTRVAVLDRNASYRNQVLPTRAALPQQSTGPRHLPHVTGYDRQLSISFLCRCANPTRHGDAWSPGRSTGECYSGIPPRDTTGTRLTWEEGMHRSFDILGKDYARDEEVESTEKHIFSSETLRLLEKQAQNSKWAHERGLAQRFIPHDAIWYGRTNPKGCYIGPAPEDPDAVFIGAHGGYRPGPTASAQGTRLQGRSTTLGHTWGASQVNRSDSSSTQQQGRSTTMDHSWGASQTDRGSSYSHSRR